MNEMNIFEVAAKNKFRFTFKGMVSTEDLYDLSVNDLDSIFKSLNQQLKKASEDSLLEVKSSEDREIEMKIDIVKHIVKTKLDEQSSRLQAKERSEKRNKILEILSSKQEDSLKNKSEEELMLMLKELEG